MLGCRRRSGAPMGHPGASRDPQEIRVLRNRPRFWWREEIRVVCALTRCCMEKKSTVEPSHIVFSALIWTVERPPRQGGAQKGVCDRAVSAIKGRPGDGFTVNVNATIFDDTRRRG